MTTPISEVQRSIVGEDFYTAVHGTGKWGLPSVSWVGVVGDAAVVGWDGVTLVVGYGRASFGPCLEFRPGRLRTCVRHGHVGVVR